MARSTHFKNILPLQVTKTSETETGKESHRRAVQLVHPVLNTNQQKIDTGIKINIARGTERT